MRYWIKTLGLAFLCGVAATAMGATVHFDGKPETVDQGTTLGVKGVLSGLGTQEFTVRVRATGTANIHCVNPGGNDASGQDRETPVTAAGEAMVSAASIAEGRASFDVATAEPHVTGLSCPNDHWTPEVRDVTFRTVTVRVFQAGRVVFRRTWTM